jgi:hypothetical protein
MQDNHVVQVCNENLHWRFALKEHQHSSIYMNNAIGMWLMLCCILSIIAASRVVYMLILALLFLFSAICLMPFSFMSLAPKSLQRSFIPTLQRETTFCHLEN